MKAKGRSAVGLLRRQHVSDGRVVGENDEAVVDWRIVESRLGDGVEKVLGKVGEELEAVVGRGKGSCV